MRERFARFMAGRYGNDQLNRFLSIVTLILLVISLFTIRFLFWIALGLLIYTYFRMLSRNIAARSAENEGFLNKTGGIRRKFRISRNRFSQRKTYAFFKCPSCHQEVRVPKGKGHIMITCPKCRTEFDKTT